ncbi:MAG: alpha/beta fold hydrolase [Acidobacteria bacterium]|nr:alpha/beta fold hydrolase [Acidobacteriota bacterium]
MSESMRREFEIVSEEGLPIRGVLEIPHDPKRLAIVVHGFKGFKEWGFFPWLCERLSESGIVACRFDMSRNGIGEDPETFERLDLFADDTYSIQLSDLEKVAEHLGSTEDLSKLPVFLIGHSRGGAIALLASRRLRSLAGIVTWNAIASTDRWDDETKRQWRGRGHLDIENSRTGQIMRMSTAVLDDLEQNRESLDVIAAVESMSPPLLVVQGGSDETVSSADADAIAAAHHCASKMVISRASHTFNAIHPLVNVPPELDLAAHVTARFITSYH